VMMRSVGRPSRATILTWCPLQELQDADDGDRKTQKADRRLFDLIIGRKSAHAHRILDEWAGLRYCLRGMIT
jgi:hypothetical protein